MREKETINSIDHRLEYNGVCINITKVRHLDMIDEPNRTDKSRRNLMAVCGTLLGTVFRCCDPELASEYFYKWLIDKRKPMVYTFGSQSILIDEAWPLKADVTEWNGIIGVYFVVEFD